MVRPSDRPNIASENALRIVGFVAPTALAAAAILATACGSGTASPNSSGAGGGGGASAADFCALTQTAVTDQKPTLKFDLSTTLADMQSQFGTYTKDVDSMDGAAPASIATPLHGYRANVDQTNAVTQAATKTADTVNGFAALLQVVVGGKTVDAYTQQNCGVTLNIGSGEDLQNLLSPSPSAAPTP
jgi:hypothetical protein